MDEGVINKAIFYGASIFLTLATITIVINYFSTARDMSNRLEMDNVIYNKYSKILEATMKKNSLFGYEVKNLMSYFYENEDVYIYVNGNLINENINNYNNYIWNINPTQKYHLTVSNVNGIVKYNIN